METGTERVKCPYCGAANMWPDLCAASEAADDSTEWTACDVMIEAEHEVDDHRRCTPDACEWAARYLAPVLRLGVAECRRTGMKFAVVSTLIRR